MERATTALLLAAALAGCATTSELIAPDTYSIKAHGRDADLMANAVTEAYKRCPGGFDVIAVQPKTQVPVVVKCHTATSAPSEAGPPEPASTEPDVGGTRQ